MPEPTNLASTKHPHEPMRDPVLDAEGRCLVCAVTVMAEVLSEALDYFLARDEMNAKVHLSETRWSPITLACQDRMRWWRDWMYPPAEVQLIDGPASE